MTRRPIGRRLPFALVAVAIAATAAVPVAQASTQARRSFVFYAKPTRAQFVDRASDRARGDVSNPFSADELPTPANANKGKQGFTATQTLMNSTTTEDGISYSVR